jgi:kojibiose phosphorylase
MDGTEQCALWDNADDEMHNSAGVAFAVLRYVAATGDQEFLRDCGLEILIETARFWAGRVDRDDAGRPHLLAVMGPDEYTPMSRDNAFTNHLVKYTLGETARLLSQAVARGDGAWRQLCERLEFDPQEIAAFEEIARDLPVPFDSKRNLVLQCADFEDYAPIDIDGLWDDRQRAFGHSVTLNKLYRSRVIKQADVIQLMTMRPHDFTDDQVRTAYRYYAPLTVHDSSLSPAAHSIAAARIGDWDEVDQLFRLALAVDFDDAAGGAAEGIHIANCGCLWQLLVGGLAGFDFDTGEVTRTGSVPLPGGLTRIAAHLVHGDEQKTVVVSARPSDEENTDRKRQK